MSRMCFLYIRSGGPKWSDKVDFTNKQEYLGSLRKVGKVYQEIISNYYPVMAMLQVAALIEDEAKVEIEVAAMLS